MPAVIMPILVAATDDGLRHRMTSRLIERFGEWWQAPAAILAVLATVAVVVWLSRRDTTDVARPLRAWLTLLRLSAVAAVLVALIDIERISEHEISLPSRVAVVVDASASMGITDEATGASTSRSRIGLDLLDEGGLLAALRQRHDVSLWRFEANAEPVALLPKAGLEQSDRASPEPVVAPTEGPLNTWREAIAPIGVETRLGEALARVVDHEPSGSLSGVVVITDGGNNAGIDPATMAVRLAAGGIILETIGIGSETLPANVRVADLLVPPRVFPGDGFAVTAYLQAQGLEGKRVRVELRELPTSEATLNGPGQPTSGGRLVDTLEAILEPDGEIAAVRFDVPGLRSPGSRTLVVRVAPPPEDRTPADDVATAVIEVVDRVTNVLVMSGGPGREYQFLRNVLHRDPSFEVDVLLGTASPGISQDARQILDGFPPSDEAIAAYDAIVAIDFDWRSLEPAAIPRLERWVARQSGGLLLVAGGIHMDAWLSDPGGSSLRGLFPVELRRPGQLPGAATGEEEPMPLEFTRDGLDSEFLWLAATRDASQAIWSEFPGVYACHPATDAKPGATVYARVAKPGATAGEPRRIYLAGQFYGAGSVLYAGSGELWRLRSVADGAYERLVAQLVRHVSQGRLSQGARRAKLLVDRDRYPVGSTVQVRLVVADEAMLAATAGRPPTCRAVGPDGEALVVPLAAENDRPGTLIGSFVATREGSWRLELDPTPGLGDERLVRRIQVQLPDRELARPRLDRALLENLATTTGGTARFPAPGEWKGSDSLALVDSLPDRSRREFETGVADMEFKQWLNTTLLAISCTCLCLEWIFRRLAKLA